MDNSIKSSNLLLKEAPVISDRHLGYVGQSEILLFRGVIQYATKINVGRDYLQVWEADFTLQMNQILLRMANVTDVQLT